MNLGELFRVLVTERLPIRSLVADLELQAFHHRVVGVGVNLPDALICGHEPMILGIGWRAGAGWRRNVPLLDAIELKLPQVRSDLGFVPSAVRIIPVM